MRRHGWQRPLHPLQMVGITVFGLLVAAYYCFLGLFLGNRIAEIAVTTVFSSAALSAALLFIRCTAIDPTDKTRFRFRKRILRSSSNSDELSAFGWSTLGQVLARLFRRMERRILRSCIRRKYVVLDPPLAVEPALLLLPPLVVRDDDSIAPRPKLDDISFCSLCDFQVQNHSKHCRTCNRCVEGFDHHCRWLNNCVGKKNYTTFILLMIFVLIMLIIEGGTAIAIFIRCFADRRGIEQELVRRQYVKFPRGVLAAISVLLVLMTAYCSAALGQLFFFHVLLIRKGMRTYDYILAMKEENQFMELESTEEDSDYSSDESLIDSGSPEKPKFISGPICRAGMNQDQSIISLTMKSCAKISQFQTSPQRLSIRIDGKATGSSVPNKKQGFHARINPWKLITISQEKALLVANRAKERLRREKTAVEEQDHDLLQPLPLETKSGPVLLKPNKFNASSMGRGPSPLVSKEMLPLPGSPGKFSSPRRRFSCSPTMPMPPGSVGSPKRRYRSNFDLQLTQVSRELETYISRQVLCSILRKDGNEVASPK